MAGDDEIEKPENWGEAPPHYQELTKNMKKQFINNSYSKKDLPGVKKEFDDCLESLKAIGPAVKGSMYLVPTEELLNDQNLQEWLLLDESRISHFPLSLPFNKTMYLF